MTRTKWQVFFLMLALVAFVALAHSVGTAVSQDDEPPCPKADEAVYQRFADAMQDLAQNPVCEGLWEKFRVSTNLATAKWIASQARHENCWR